ncbi:MAG: hypothetical protein LUQ05_06470 [Methanoregula sp.]|nr:hypothetical protein [Methanoregula sp.]
MYPGLVALVQDIEKRVIVDVWYSYQLWIDIVDPGQSAILPAVLSSASAIIQACHSSEGSLMTTDVFRITM